MPTSETRRIVWPRQYGEAGRIATAGTAVAVAVALWLVSWYAPQLFPPRLNFSRWRMQLWAGRIIVECAQLGPQGRDPATGRPYRIRLDVRCGRASCNPCLRDLEADKGEARMMHRTGDKEFGTGASVADASWRNGFGFYLVALDHLPQAMLYSVGVPIWPLPVPFVAWWLWGWWRQRRRRLRGQCLQCGYDLRASPERCPECGASVRPGGVKEVAMG